VGAAGGGSAEISKSKLDGFPCGFDQAQESGGGFRPFREVVRPVPRVKRKSSVPGNRAFLFEDRARADGDQEKSGGRAHGGNGTQVRAARLRTFRAAPSHPTTPKNRRAGDPDEGPTTPFAQARWGPRTCGSGCGVTLPCASPGSRAEDAWRLPPRGIARRVDRCCPSAPDKPRRSLHPYCGQAERKPRRSH